MQNSELPNNPEIHPLLLEAHGHVQQNNLLAARNCYDQLLNTHPDSLDILYMAGAISIKMQDYPVAVARLSRYLTLKTDNALAWTYFAMSLSMVNRMDQALTCVEHAIALNPTHVDNFNLKGNILRKLKQYGQALSCYEQAVGIAPEDPDSLNNKGVALWDLQQFAQSKTVLKKALAIKPNDSTIMVNLANTLRDMGDEQGALALYDDAFTVNPACHDAQFNASMVLLAQGKFAEGWDKYESRWYSSSFPTPRRDFTQPQWSGKEDLSGKTILLHTEQGFGDTIQFCRYAQQLAGLGANIVIEAEVELIPLLCSLQVKAALVTKGQPLPAFDYHSPLMSLPRVFGTTLTNIPSTTPYLGVSSQLLHTWQQRLGEKSKLRIGIAWSGNMKHPNDHNRSAPLAALVQGLPVQAAQIDWVALQKFVVPGDMDILAQVGSIKHFGAQMTSFADTAAIIFETDLVITVDTAVAHIAGALGKPVWLLVPHKAEWRWMKNRTDTPWYPTMRIFRQTAPGNWQGVFNDVAAALRTTHPQTELVSTKQNVDELKREEAIRALIPDGATICNVTLGGFDLQRALPKHCEYLEYKTALSSRQFVVAENIDKSALEKADLITLVDIIEYVDNVPKLLDMLHTIGREVILTYHTTNTVSADKRGKKGWVNHLSNTDIAKLFVTSGFSVNAMDMLPGGRMLFKLSPVKQVAHPLKRVAVLSYGNVGNFGDRLGFHLVHSVLPANASVEHFHFQPWNVPDLSGYDLLILGIGNSLFAPLMTEALERALDQVPRAIGIFGTQYRDDIDKATMSRIISKLDRWYARHGEDVLLYGKGHDNVVHFGDWLIDAFPLTPSYDPSILTVGDEIWKDLPLDRTIQQIQRYKHVISTRLHPLLCALTSADVVQYCEQRDNAKQEVSGKFRSMLIDIFDRDYPENIAWTVDKKKVMQYKQRISENMQVLRLDIAYILNGENDM